MWASLASFSRISVRTSTHSPSFGAGCTPRSYRNSVALPRITLRTVARDTDSVLTISLIGKCRSKNARRIWPILSTPIIPISSSRPPQATEGDIDETSEGSALNAKNPPQGVIIASEFTIEGFWSLLRSWLRPHRGISQDKLPLYLSFFQFVHNARQRGKALLGALVEAIVG